MKIFSQIVFDLLSVITLLELVKCTSNSEDIYLFSSSPIIQIPQNQICDKDFKIEKLLLLPNFKSQQILGWGSKCGWNLICFEDSSNISIKKLQIQAESPQAMVNQDNLIWIAYESTLIIYKFTFDNELQIKQIMNKQSTKYSTTNIYFSDDQKFLFVLSQYTVESYQISDLSNIKYLNTITRVENIFSMSFSTHLNYVVLGLRAGIALYKWQVDIAQSTYTATEQCFRQELITGYKVEFLNITQLVIQTYVQGLWVVDLSSFLEGAPCNSVQFNFIQGKESIIIYMNYMLISKNQRYIISEQKLQSISIFEVKLQGDYIFPLLQEIEITEKTFDLQISLDQQFIFSSSFTAINIYMRSIPNYKNRIPNIQNGDQNYVFSDFPINTNAGRRCVLKDNLLFYAKMMDGVYILKVDPYTHYLKVLSRVISNPGYYELAMPLADPTKLILGNSELKFYDITDLTKPVFKFSTGFLKPNIDADYITISKDQKTGYIAGGFEGLMIVDLSDFNNPTLISSIHHNYMTYSVTTSENVHLDSKEQYAYVAYRYFGVIVYNVQDKEDPKIVSHIQTNGAEDLKLTSDDKFMIIADIHRGITIVNIQDPTNIFEVSNLYVEGETLRTTFVSNEDFLLSVSLSRGQLQLIDIRDKLNPILLQKYQYQKKSNANDVCITDDNSIAYLMLNQQIIMMNLFPSNKQFNIDFLLVQQGKRQIFNFQTVINNYFNQINIGNTPLKKMLNVNDVILLGQKIEIKLVQIYPENRVQVTDVKYYDNYLQYDLPNWATFQEIQQKVTIDITNDALDKQNPNAVTMKSFLFQIKEPLQSTDFIRTELNIDQDKSNLIYLNCLKNRLVSSENLVIESQQEIILGTFSSYTEDEQHHILKILKSKIVYYPVYINVKSSLEIFAKADTQGILQVSEKNLEIQSISDSVKVQVVVLPDQGQFQKYLYPGVLVYFNENQDTIKLEGDITAINKIFKLGGFKFANYTFHEDIILSITIDDTINYPVTMKFKASNPNLVTLNNKVVNNENYSIQSDFTSRFPDASVYILSSFSYTFSNNIFFDQDNDHLTYSAKIQIDGEFQQIPESFWLNFQQQDRTFYGATKASQFGDRVKLKVIASDGYTEAFDILEIKIFLVPVTYILQMTAQIAGPILGLLGLWRYKALFCNCIRKKKYQGSKLFFTPNSVIEIQIPLLEDQLELAQKIWKQFYSQLDRRLILLEINQLKQSYKSYQNNSLAESVLMKNESLPQTSKQLHFQQKQEYSTNVKTENNTLHQIKTEAHQLFSPISSPANDASFTDSQTIQPPETPTSATKENKDRNTRKKQKTQHNYIKQAKSQLLEKSRQQRKMGIVSSKSIHFRDNLNLEYFQLNGHLNNLNILKKVQDYYIKHIKNPNNFVIEQLESPTSKLSQSIISLCSIEIAILEKTPITLLNFLRETAIQEGYDSKDWYRSYVQIVPQFNQVFIDPFPKLIYNETKIIKQINIIKCNMPDESETDIHLYLPLVKENIKSIAYGLTFDKSKFLSKIRGESLEIFTHNILCIKTYRPIKKRVFSCFTCQRKQSEVYIEKELSQNSMVPSWITSVDISNGVLLISGKLQLKDVGQYILKIYDTQQFIIKQIEIVVQSKNEGQLGQSQMISQQRQILKFQNQSSPNGDINLEDIPLEKNNIEFKIYSYKQTQKNSEYTSANSLFDTIN